MAALTPRPSLTELGAGVTPMTVVGFVAPRLDLRWSILKTKF